MVQRLVVGSADAARRGDDAGGRCLCVGPEPEQVLSPVFGVRPRIWQLFGRFYAGEPVLFAGGRVIEMGQQARLTAVGPQLRRRRWNGRRRFWGVAVNGAGAAVLRRRGVRVDDAADD